MTDTATLKVEELSDGSMVLTWDENDPKCSLLNGKTEEEIVAMIEKGLETMILEEKQARLKALKQLVEHDQQMGLY